MASHYEERNGVLHYNFDKSLEYIETEGKKQFGTAFTIHEEDVKLIYRLMVYFIKDEGRCMKYGLNPSKGLLLTGPVGCGKTSLMHLMRLFSPQTIVVKPAREITFEFMKDGYDVIHKYGKRPVAFCFDDLGVEQSIKYYGNECNAIAEILLSRYDLYVGKRIVTHATTNLNANELEKIYGNRVRSRMRQLFNLVSFDGGSKDKRK